MAKGPKDPINARRREEQARIAAALGQIGFALPGSVAVRNYRCGKDNCACHDDPQRLHGPSIQWTRKINAKTLNRVLSEEQWCDYEAWFDNARKLRALVADLERLSLEVFEEDDRWTRQSPS
ncbi:MAG: hypothetical protein M0Z69_13575 [Actinomycetota bacterium]|nr:hypothetical protein [Actinomycetota bacterium]